MTYYVTWSAPLCFRPTFSNISSFFSRSHSFESADSSSLSLLSCYHHSLSWRGREIKGFSIAAAAFTGILYDCNTRTKAVRSSWQQSHGLPVINGIPSVRIGTDFNNMLWIVGLDNKWRALPEFIIQRGLVSVFPGMYRDIPVHSEHHLKAHPPSSDLFFQISNNIGKQWKIEQTWRHGPFSPLFTFVDLV